MDIKKSSWHYKLVDFMCDYHSRSLCDYVWQVIRSVIVVLLVIVFFMAITGVIGGLILDKAFSYDSPSLLLMVTLLPVVGAITLSVVGALCFGVIYYTDNYFKQRTKLKEGMKPKPDGILTAYIKAKKEKLCPQLKFVDSPETKDED